MISLNLNIMISFWLLKVKIHLSKRKANENNGIELQELIRSIKRCNPTNNGVAP